jgi:MFS family permease
MAVISTNFITAFRHRDFVILSLAQWVSTMGFWTQRVAAQWLAWQLTKSYAWLGGIVLAEAITLICVMPIAGALADRRDRLKIARSARLLGLVSSLGIAFLTYINAISIWTLMFLVMLTGMADGVWMPVRWAMIPNLVPRKHITAAVSINSVLFNLSQFAGPALAGLIIIKASIEFAFLANAIACLVLLAALFVIHIEKPAGYSNTPVRFFHDIKEGVLYTLHHKAIAPIMLIATMTSLLLRPVREFFAGYADEFFGVGANGVATLFSSMGLGALTAALFLSLYGRSSGLVKLTLISLLGAAVVQIVFSTTPSYELAVACSAALGFCFTCAGTGSQILIQNNLPDDKRGRVMSLWTTQVRSAPSIGAWTMGFLAGMLTMQTVLVLAAIIFLAAWLFLYINRNQLKPLEH